MALQRGARQTFTATFRGEGVRALGSRQTFSTTSVYGTLYAVMTYRRTPDGSIDFAPSVVRTFATPESCFREIRYTERLRQWEGQSFVVALKPGCTEVAEAEVVTVR